MFFDGVTPTALKSLLIESYVPLVPADICPILRSFTLRTRLHLWPPYSSPLPPLVRFLSHTPLLEDLRLDVAPCHTRAAVCDPLPPPASLPRLRSLSLASFEDVGWSDLVIPAAPSPSCGFMSRELMGVTVDTDRDGHRWVVSGRSRAAPGLHVTTVAISAQARLPRWLAESTDTLRIIVRRSGLATRDVPAFTALPDFQLLDTLIVRLAVGGFALARLSFWLARTDPPTCPSLRVLVLSILNPRCTLDALRPLYEATTHRAELGHPL